MILIQFIIGTALGSFLFASYSRLSVSGNIWRPLRSQCDSCSSTIIWFDLVPIYSYLMLGGRCRNCNQPIAKAALISELFFGNLLLYWQPTFHSTLFVLAGSLLFFMAVSDAHRCEFPVGYSYALIFCAITVYTLFTPHHLIFVSIILMWLGLQFFEPHLTWIGSGDLDVFLCLLILLGFVSFAWLLLLSSLSALITGFLFKRRRLPFIPFVAASYLPVIFFLP